MIYSLTLLALQALAVAAKTVTYDWNIGWVTVSPDGYSRPAIGINGVWPCPPISIDIGDRVVINLNNNLGNETTAIHFHGIFQTGSAQMDGPAMVNQCPIPPGSSMLPGLAYGVEANMPQVLYTTSSSTNQARTGTMPMSVGSISMVCAGH